MNGWRELMQLAAGSSLIGCGVVRVLPLRSPGFPGQLVVVAPILNDVIELLLVVENALAVGMTSKKQCCAEGSWLLLLRGGKLAVRGAVNIAYDEGKAIFIHPTADFRRSVQ